MSREYTTVLTIAGFDGSGGAGIQADLKTFAALECYGLSVLTALPIQNTCGVRSIYSIEKQCIVDQIQSVFEDTKVDAIKIGMLHRSEVIECVATALQPYLTVPVVLDPVMVATSGDALMVHSALELMLRVLFPLMTVLTPNLDEASLILGRKIYTEEEMEIAARDLSRLGPKAVIVKGGHHTHSLCSDCLYIADTESIHWFSSKRVVTKNTHGTGCTFSAALAAFLAKDYQLVEATHLAKSYLACAVEAGAIFQLGRGYGPLHHFFSHWDSIDMHGTKMGHFLAKNENE